MNNGQHQNSVVRSISVHTVVARSAGNHCRLQRRQRNLRTCDKLTLGFDTRFGTNERPRARITNANQRFVYRRMIVSNRAEWRLALRARQRETPSGSFRRNDCRLGRFR